MEKYQADHGKKRDPRDDEIKEMMKMELDNVARLKKRTLLMAPNYFRNVP